MPLSGNGTIHGTGRRRSVPSELSSVAVPCERRTAVARRWKNCAKLPGGAGGGGVAAGCDVGYQQRGRGFEAAGGFHPPARAGRHGRQLACWPVGRGGSGAATEGGGGECPGLLSQLSYTLSSI